MAHLKDEIKDEKKGHEHYEALANKDPRNRAILKKMAEDEEDHGKKLRGIEKAEKPKGGARARALKKVK